MEGVIVKQNVGIDISKENFIACFCFQRERGMLSLGKPVQYKVKYYAKSLNIKTKTDWVDARIIAQMGIERDLQLWTPPKPVYQKLRALTRYLQELKEQKLMIGNYLEALTHSVFSEDFVIKSQKTLLQNIEKQIKECEKRIATTIKSDAELSEKVKNLETIKGVGLTTIAVIIAETQGFALITSGKQLASYAGLDVVERQSGTSIKGKTTISKKGNKRIRNALYFPAIVASMHNKPLKEDYQRITAHKSHKKIGIVALQRKLLLLMYALWKKNEIFQPEMQKLLSNSRLKFSFVGDKDSIK
ncbi:MAG: IS110 family transposase [Bacteroidales bacterium]|jgi:transposase|nr:IS110 family transposase [Bacteroidales bacterium]